MMLVALIALALLCGVSIGVIVGLAIAYASARGRLKDDLEIDYSGDI